MNHQDHYKDEYFHWHGDIGEFGGWANLDKFIEYVEDDFKVIDFGCGGGYLLKNLNCKEKIGIEINDSARRKASELNITTVNSTKLIPDNFADLIISNNALEHTTHPLDELKELYKKLRVGGKIVFVVPCESINYHYVENDINYHLYSWSPMCIGNLFNEAGFKVLESKPYIHKWPPNYQKLAKIFNRRIFNIICKLYARIEPSWHQVRVVATKDA